MSDNPTPKYVSCHHHGGPYDAIICALPLGDDGAPRERTTFPDQEKFVASKRHVYERVPAVDGGWSYLYVGYLDV